MYTPVDKVWEELKTFFLTPDKIDDIEYIQWAEPYYRVGLKNGVVFRVMDWHDIPAVLATSPTPPSTYIAKVTYAQVNHGTGLLSDDSDDYPPLTSSTVNKLQNLLGPIADYETNCPACGSKRTLWSLVQHLNDSHKWSREQIADWMETLDIDLTIAYVHECDWCRKKYHDTEDVPPFICSDKCGKKLADFVIDHKGDKLTEEQQRILIDAIRELDEMENLNGLDGSIGS